MRFDAKALPNGTVLLLGVGYLGSQQPGGDTRGRSNPKVYTYAALKAGGLWYMTGMGDVPQAAGWPVIERWLGKKDRTLVWVKGTVDSAMATLWESSPESPAREQVPCPVTGCTETSGDMDAHLEERHRDLLT